MAWGLDHRDLSNIKAIGIDEVLWHRGHKYMMVVYNISIGRRRILWLGKDRKEEAIQSFLDSFGDRAMELVYVCSDMWKPYLKVVAERAGQAIHVLERFHIVANINKTIDKAKGFESVLKSKRWLLVKRPENLTEKQTISMNQLIQYNLKSVNRTCSRKSFRGSGTTAVLHGQGSFLSNGARLS